MSAMQHINVENLKAVIRDKAWHELPPVLQLKERPHFQYISQYFVLTQTDGNLCLVKHYYVKDDKVPTLLVCFKVVDLKSVGPR